MAAVLLWAELAPARLVRGGGNSLAGILGSVDGVGGILADARTVFAQAARKALSAA
ncbi:hypothetical protein HNQ71_003985 [Mesorhizobium sangaii]|uniref:Uncharacterized protein n=1 Tax=Mesorhizobium sangaii TaxID=505389 RepID=A0A841PCB9_9HYPH|nr:hypothetical protein [Mesorhizobium sangaii]